LYPPKVFCSELTYNIIYTGAQNNVYVCNLSPHWSPPNFQNPTQPLALAPNILFTRCTHTCVTFYLREDDIGMLDFSSIWHSIFVLENVPPLPRPQGILPDVMKRGKSEKGSKREKT
jgi:hypothetical protein